MRTPLYAAHAALGARLVPFAGWEMPLQYAGILAEHRWTRTEASVFDTCHMGEFDVGGPDAERDLERLLTARVGTLRVGRCRYGYLLDGQGGVLDDLTCYRFAADRFRLVVNAGTRERDAAWMRAHLSSGTRFEDRSDETAKLDVQGPRAAERWEAALGEPLPRLGFFQFAERDVVGAAAVVSRTGYTGEWGVEVYLPADKAERLWSRLTAPGDIRPAGLGARDTLRMEMGYPLYGHELDTGRSPVAAARGRFVDTGKDFVGRATVLRDLERGCEAYLAGLRLDSRRAARPGDTLRGPGGAPAGSVTSGAFAPSLGTAAALAYVRADLALPGTRLRVDARGGELEAEVAELPLYRAGTARRDAPF